MNINPRTSFLKFLYFIIVFVWVYISFIASNTDNPVHLSYNSAQEIYSFVPQGWAFFTRDPKEEVVQLYMQQDDDLILINKSASLSFKDFFGLKRDVRKKSAELAEILKKIPSRKWSISDDLDKLKNLRSLNTTDTIINVFEEKLLRGNYVIYSSRRKPWAWAKSETKIPYRYIKIYIK